MVTAVPDGFLLDCCGIVAGMMFAVEEIHKTFSIPILLPVMTASVTADYIASHILGLDPVFHFQITEYLPQNYYWLLILLGILVGVSGVFYNWGMLKAQELYRKIPFLKETGRLLIAFLTAGVLGLVMPSVLGSGSGLIVSLTKGEMVLGMVVLTLVVKFLFSAVSFGSGAPGGIFFPLLMEEAYAGDIIGVFDPGIFAIGDTLCASNEKFQFEGIPTFAPEHFARVRQVDTMKRKQFIKGVNQIAQEGAIQIFQEFNSGMEDIQLAYPLKEYGENRLQYLFVIQRIRQRIGTDKQAESVSVQLRYLFLQCHNRIIQNHGKKIQIGLYITHTGDKFRRKASKADTCIRRYFMYLYE